MSEAEILGGVSSVARAHLQHEGELDPKTPLVTGLRLDSVRMLTLVVELENHFAVNLEDGDEVGLETVGDLVALLRRRLDANA